MNFHKVVGVVAVVLSFHSLSFAQVKEPIYMDQEAIETRLLGEIYNSDFGLSFQSPHTRFPNEVFANELIRVSAKCGREIPDSIKQELIGHFESKHVQLIDQVLRVQGDGSVNWESYYKIRLPSQSDFNVGVAIKSPVLKGIRVLGGYKSAPSFVYAIPVDETNEFLNLKNWKVNSARFVCNPTKTQIENLVNFWVDR